MENSSTPSGTSTHPAKDRRRKASSSPGAPGLRLLRRPATRDRLGHLQHQLEETRTLLTASETVVSCREEQVRDLEVQVEMLVQELARSQRLLERSQQIMLEAMQALNSSPNSEGEPLSTSTSSATGRPRDLPQSCTRRRSLTLRTFTPSDPGARRSISN